MKKYRFNDLRNRIKACVNHLFWSMVLATSAAGLVFFIWYPSPYREISGGRELFQIIVTVDLLIGPLITFFVFDIRKPSWKLRCDLFIVAIIQLSALGYGLWTVAMARPVYVVFEIDRFRVVHAIEINEDLLRQAPDEFQGMPWTGPSLLSIRAFRNTNEEMQATLAAVQGVPLGARPDLWQSYSAALGEVLNAAKPVKDLLERFPESASAIKAELLSMGRAPEQVLVLPLVGRNSFWTIFVDSFTAEVITAMPLDPF